MKIFNNLSIIFLIFFISQYVNGDNNEDQIEKLENQDLVYTANLSEFIDKNYEGIQEALRKFEPLESIDRTYSILKLVSLKLTNGQVQRVSYFNRTGNCSLKYNKKTDSLEIDLNIGWDELAIDYLYSFKRFLISAKGDLHILFYKSSMNLVLNFDIGNHRASLKKLKLDKVGKYDLKIQGSWLVVNEISNLFLKLFPRRKFVSEVEKISTMIVQKNIDKLNENLSEILKDPEQSKIVDAFLEAIKTKQLNDLF